MREQIKAQARELAYMRGMSIGLEAQLAATKMERPADLEDWIREVALPDMSDEERAEWDAMSDAQRETFMDQLGQRINATELLATAGAGEAPSPEGSAQGS